MKRVILKSLTAQVALLLLLILSVNARDNNFIKNYNKVYDVKDDTELEILNKFGNVDVRDWNKNTISIDVEVIANTSNNNRAENILENIDVVFSEIGNRIKVETSIGKMKRTFNLWGGDKKRYEINYIVNMPKNIPLNLLNKYGDVFISELTSTSNIEVKYGNLKANSIIHNEEKPLTKIILAYSNGTIEECKWIKLNIKYSKIEINKSKALVVVSKYSKVYVDEGTSVVSESKYDNFRIGNIQNFHTTTAYSNLKFDKISNKLQAESKYSDFKIENMPPDFSKISIDNKYGSYKIGVDSKASYLIDAHGKYAKIHYPESAKVSITKDDNETSINGLVGDNQNTESTVNINTKYGNVKLIKE
ncbi:MAG: hypothetical protein JSV22_11635 [Bacteroidales bacterium]|nr:MAG: hypothetical protein JSV22_11635 [Bacteroidales bacterium]